MAGNYNYYAAQPATESPYAPVNDYDDRFVRDDNRYQPDRPLQQQRMPTSEYSYYPDDSRSRRSRADSTYGARSVYSEAPPQERGRERRDKPSWLVTGLLTALVVATFAGFQVWQLRMQDGKGGLVNDQKDREKRENQSTRSRRREEVRQREDRRRDREDSPDDERTRGAQVPQIEWTAVRRQRTRRTSRPPRRPEYQRSEDEYGYDDDYRDTRSNDGSQRSRDRWT